MEKTLHISQTGDNWEVEDQSQTLAQAESKEEAIEAAKEVALVREVEQIVVHTAEGGVEKSILVNPKVEGE